MKFDLLHVMKHFAIEDNRLIRKLVSGSRVVRLADRGRLAVTLDGVRYFGPELAWACIYRAVPMFPIVQVDGNPHNMAENNLMPCRIKRIRYLSVSVPGGYKHALSKTVFRTEGENHADWCFLARQYYQRDKPYVREMEDTARGRAPEVPKHVPVARKVWIVPTDHHIKPEAVAGRSWHWWQSDWISLPEAVHPSDDWMARAEVVALHPDARFVYDPLIEQTVAAL